MTNRNADCLKMHRSCRRVVEAEFSGGDITSDGGVLLLEAAERRTGLIARVARQIQDPRRAKSCVHKFSDLLRQRVFAVGLGYEDLNDHESLRRDIAIQTAVGRDEALAHPTTLCRLENRADRSWAWAVHRALFENFVASFDAPPDEVVLDFDATDDQVHGEQVGRYFHGHYNGYCFLPLYVFSGDHLLVAMLRRSSEGAAAHAVGVLALLVRHLRRTWPGVRVVFRGDAGFCKPALLRWCDLNRVDYVVGLQRNPKIVGMVQPQLDAARQKFEETGEATREFIDLEYQAKSWHRPHRVVAKAEYLPAVCGRRAKANPRFVVTNLDVEARQLYEQTYCARGDMENRIKEQQLDLFADRTSCHRWWPNQWRLLVASLAYTLLATIRRTGLAGTPMANAQCGTIRLKLLKIGAVLLRNTRRVRFLLTSAYPYQSLFFGVLRRLKEPVPIGSG